VSNPVFLSKSFISYLNYFYLYPLLIYISKILIDAIAEDNLASDRFPDPPTPTSNEFPLFW